MTALAKARFRKYLRQKEHDRQVFIKKIKALSSEQKKEILVRAGVLTKQGKFTARYRTKSASRPVKTAKRK